MKKKLFVLALLLIGALSFADKCLAYVSSDGHVWMITYNYDEVKRQARLDKFDVINKIETVLVSQRLDDCELQRCVIFDKDGNKTFDEYSYAPMGDIVDTWVTFNLYAASHCLYYGDDLRMCQLSALRYILGAEDKK